MSPAVRDAIPTALSKRDTATSLDTDTLDPAFAKVIWDLSGKAVVQPVMSFAIPNSLRLNPMRRIGTYPGAPNRIGMFPITRDGLSFMVTCESRLEGYWGRYLYMHGQTDTIYAQPFALLWEVGQRAIIRFPDFLLATRTGWVVVDVKPESALAADPHAQALFDLTRRSVTAAGGRYLHLGDMPLQAQTNIDTIARYRLPNRALMPLMRTVALLRPRYAGEVLDLCGGVCIGREVLFTLVANGLIELNYAEPISGATPLRWMTETENP